LKESVADRIRGEEEQAAEKLNGALDRALESAVEAAGVC
jgi:hypothetical protein